MKKSSLALLIEFNPVTFIEMTDRKVAAIYIDDKIIGYVATNVTSEEKIITPFTALGELPEVDCHLCAARALFANYADLSKDSVKGAEFEKEIFASFEINANTIKDFIKDMLGKPETRH
ncbi:hypothetical protein [Erwinia phyllosphaerae]|uniref:hypothetical protein n=1 Tax=Erwinia phyllosphaerae TaxID=2853256 RepID=UPI001FF0124A|nr:hypothetical protein [Erwinia phyllosphaerae]MBV4366255.1 hypothetical protein [Erwinia phyllosphaerae]